MNYNSAGFQSANELGWKPGLQVFADVIAFQVCITRFLKKSISSAEVTENRRKRLKNNSAISGVFGRFRWEAFLLQ